MTDHAYPPQAPADLAARSLDDLRARIQRQAERMTDAAYQAGKCVHARVAHDTVIALSEEDYRQRAAFERLLSETFRALERDLAAAGLGVWRREPTEEGA